MAQNKNSFILYCDLIHTVRKMPKEKQAELFMHILEYVNDENPATDDIIINLTFEPIKQSLKRDLIKYEEKCKKNTESILKRWNKNNTNVYDGIQTNTKHTDSDNVNDSVSDTDSEILFKKEPKIKDNGFDSFWLLYPKKVAKEKCKSIYDRLSSTDKKKISDSLLSFIGYKPFKDYTHPNPQTYLNQKRWNDEIPTIDVCKKLSAKEQYEKDFGNRMSI